MADTSSSTSTLYRDEYLKKKREEYILKLIRYNHLIDKQLNTRYSTFLKGKNKTLKECGWSRGQWFYEDDTEALGRCYVSKKIIRFNKIFLIHNINENIFKDVLNHEIAHALEVQRYGNTFDVDEGEKSKLATTCEELYSEREIAYAREGIFESLETKYEIIFEPFGKGDNQICPPKTTPVYKEPNDYFTNYGYLQSTIISYPNFHIVKENILSDNEFKQKIQEIRKKYNTEYPFNKFLQLRKNVTSSFKNSNIIKTHQIKESIDFENIYQQCVNESFSDYVKGTIAGLGMLGSTFMLPQETEGATINNPTSIKQNINTQRITKNDSDVDIIAATIFDEAKGEKKIGREAVASVIINRSKSKKYKGNPAAVCTAKYQFSGWNKGYINVDLNNKLHKQIWEECKDLANQIVNNQFTPTINSNHYYNPKLASPSWAKAMKDVFVIGNHKFGRI